ncbi:MAG TPA: hypothetical protein VGF59_04210 [Bryobacteraceae bacterium]
MADKAYLETDHVLFRGPARLKILFKDLTAVRAAGGVLRLEFEGGPASLDLGRAAEKWADKILHPPSRLSKLGVKPGMAIRLAGEFAADFVAEVGETAARGSVDLIFLAAAERRDLTRVAKLLPGLKRDGAIWVVYPKGVSAIREIEVIEAGRAAGLKDVKVASFSSTHTALKFVIPLADR